MKEEEDARAFIEETARRKGSFTNAFRREAKKEADNGRKGMLQAIEGSEEIRKDLAKALEVISSNLYTSRARFLMEVIQNADDNKYAEGERPTVSITIFPEHIKIECNEKGFTREDIQALCRTGRSSKTPGQGYTGEKGIGFKSVFKIANRVHIRSPPYYFQLDQTRELGMITPEDFFDDYIKEEQTTIILDHLRDQATDFSTLLEKDVDAIDPILILFLRRIERFNLRLFRSSQANTPAISKCFRRVDWTPDCGIVSVVDQDAKIKRFLYKQLYTMDFDGTEPRRLGTKKTDIVLAFPVKARKDLQGSGRYMPLIRKNFVFAYLPLGDFGFKFIIQADFLTTSNRQSVEEDNHWNRNIADAIPEAFEEAIDCFNFGYCDSDLDGLALTWPLYLNLNTSRGGLSTYWHKIMKSINKHLSGAEVIKDRDGNVRKPKDLMFLDWARDRNDEPMFGHMHDYVSPDYPDSVREALLLLGVTAPSWRWMGDQLKELHDNGLLHIRRRNNEWYSDLASVLLEPQVPKGDTRYARDLRMIPLIPLADGTWRCPPSEDDPIYFPASLGTTIPPGLPLSLVDKEACVCPKRRKLFRLLGVKECSIPNVIERIFDYHTKARSGKAVNLIAQLKYLYEMREHVDSDEKKIYFVCSRGNTSRRGILAYADASVDGELQQIFSGYKEAHFLDDRYFENLNASKRDQFLKWLNGTASVALQPRFNSTALFSVGLHKDFEWLLANKEDQVLAILQRHWSLYSKNITKTERETLSGHKVLCTSGGRIALGKTYIPFPKLVEKAQAFGADDCNFLALPRGDPEDWKFLSSLGVGLDEGLDFHLWVLDHLKLQADVEKSKQLYMAIQPQAFTPAEVKKVKKAFSHVLVNIPNHRRRRLKNCVWHGPKGLSSKPALQPVYGDEFRRLFQDILEVPNATSADAQKYLEQLRYHKSTSMGDVVDVYLFLQKHHADTFYVDQNALCICVPPLFGHTLEWKTPGQCVWDDPEFSQNGLKLQSKTAIRRIVEQHAPAAKAFFTDVLKLPNAGIDELLADLVLMWRTKRDDPKRVYLLYERIESSRRSYPEPIREAFKKHPLVFLRGIHKQSSQWLPLRDCIWTRSVLRSKHALMPSLNEYRGLFRETLGVQNATMTMLVTDLLNSSRDGFIEDEEFEYVKELLQEIARLQKNDVELKQLVGKKCWPCHTPTNPYNFCSIGNFYVNDRQDLFDIFRDSHTFLAFDFDTSRKVADLLRNLGCNSFLSEKVITRTESRGPLGCDRGLTKDFRGRADALVKYFEHTECESPYELRLLLEKAMAWRTGVIKTNYTLEDTTVARNDGGSSVRVSTRADGTAQLDIFVSENKSTRDCALITDFPKQLIAALELEPADLPDLHQVLQVGLDLLKTLLIRKGITSGDVADDYEETLVADSVHEDLGHQSGGSNDDTDDDASETSAESVRTDSTDSAILEVTRASARSEAVNTTLRPHVNRRPSVSSQDHSNTSSDDSRLERAVTPHPTVAGVYSPDNRHRNRERLQGFARNVEPASSPQLERPNRQSGGGIDAFDMSTLRETLTTFGTGPMSTPVHTNPSPRRRSGPTLNRNKEEMARDFEVGFLGEHFVYTLLHDTLELPDFTGEDNWTSSLRSRAGFSAFGREVSDFTYEDKQGALTRHFLQKQHPYRTPGWLSTVCDNGNVPLYRLEVKSTTNQDHTTPFYMSGRQYELVRFVKHAASEERSCKQPEHMSHDGNNPND